MKNILAALALFSLALTACKGGAGGGGKTVQKNAKVLMHYTLTVDGGVVDSSEGKEPLEFISGTGKIIPGLDIAMAGMKVGDKNNFTIPVEDAYGHYNPQLVQKVPRSNFGDNAINPGDMVQGQANGQVFRATIREVGEKEVTIDLNHPLVDKILHFNVEVVAVE